MTVYQNCPYCDAREGEIHRDTCALVLGYQGKAPMPDGWVLDHGIVRKVTHDAAVAELAKPEGCNDIWTALVQCARGG